MNTKKAFQQCVKAIREDRRRDTGSTTEYPKAMMTSAQEAKGTATVNCGGEWAQARSKPLAEAVLQDKRFRDFLTTHHGKAHLEYVSSYNYYQVRIHFKREEVPTC